MGATPTSGFSPPPAPVVLLNPFEALADERRGESDHGCPDSRRWGGHSRGIVCSPPCACAAACRRDRGRAGDGAGLSHAAGHHRGRLYAGRDQRFARAHRGRTAQRRLGSIRHRGQQVGRGRQYPAAYVARAPADGYTLMVGTDAIMTSNVFLYKNTPFDPVKDFAPITNAGANIICLAVHVDLPVNSVTELIAYAKAHPGQLQYGSSG